MHMPPTPKSGTGKGTPPSIAPCRGTQWFMMQRSCGGQSRLRMHICPGPGGPPVGPDGKQKPNWHASPGGHAWFGPHCAIGGKQICPAKQHCPLVHVVIGGQTSPAAPQVTGGGTQPFMPQHCPF